MASGILGQLEQVKANYGEGCAEAKLALLGRIAESRLPSARAVLRLHEVLCFLRAYPDNARLLARVEGLLERFRRRADVRRHRAALADTGIAGTATHYRFFWMTARWLARRWPARLRLDRSDSEAADSIRTALPLLVTPAEAEWLKESNAPGYRALDRLRGRSETDAVFLVRRVEAMPGDSRTREAFYDSIDASCVLAPGAETPSRTREKTPLAQVVFQGAALRRGRPELREQIALAPRAVRDVPAREGAGLIEFARGILATRARDLDAFGYGDAQDVRVVEDGRGLAFLVNGMVPERRALVMASYGYVTLQNGVPLGYGQVDLLGRIAAISFNTFATFRGGEAAWTFARLLAMSRFLFGAESFSLDPYQLGKKNDEAIASGAWWFYQKLGFRPQSAEAQRIMRGELARMKADPGHRSDRRTLRRLARASVFFDLDVPHASDLGFGAALGARLGADLAARWGAAREQALRECAREAMSITGLRSVAGFSAGERLAWTRWGALLVHLPGISRWSVGEKRALVQVVRAKGGRRESDFVALFNAHPKLAGALRSYVAGGE